MNDTPEPTTPDTDAAPAAEQAPTAPTPAAVAERTATGVDALPEWAQTEIRALRKESAGYRTRAKELEDAQKTELERTQEALEAATEKLSKTQTELTRTTVLAEFELPGEYARFLTGDEAQMKSAAQELVKLAQGAMASSLQSRPVAGLVSGAAAPGEPTEDFDPAAIAAAVRERSTTSGF